MKDKTTAGLLALFLGGAGIHRFYLNQPGMGVLYIALTLITCGVFAAIVPIIDAIVFFIMDPFQFDQKYNPKKEVHVHIHQKSPQVIPQQQTRVKEVPKVKQVEKVKKAVKKVPDNPHKITGITKFKQYDFKGAKESFKKALSIHYDDIATHFNLGCCYSMEEDINKSLFHLSKAVELGFKDFKRIDSHDALAFLRSHDEFLEFAANNYQWKTEEDQPKTLVAPEEEVLTDLDEEPTEILDLNAPIKEKVILTEEMSKEAENDISYQDTRDIFDDIFGTDEDFSPPNPIQPSGAGLSEEIMEKLRQLGNLRDKGILTDEEFNEQKKRLLS